MGSTSLIPYIVAGVIAGIVSPNIIIFPITYLILKNRENKRNVKRLIKEEAKEIKIQKERKESIKKDYEVFLRKQKSKGLIFYKNKWVTSNEKETEERIDFFVLDMKEKNKFKNAYIKCKDCGYIWRIKKEFGLPLKCGSCGSQLIAIDGRKSYYN